MPRQVQADPVGDPVGRRVVDDHAQLRPAVHGEGGEFQFEKSEFRVMEALQPFTARRHLVVAPQGFELGANSGKLLDELGDLGIGAGPGGVRTECAHHVSRRFANPPAERVRPGPRT